MTDQVTSSNFAIDACQQWANKYGESSAMYGDDGQLLHVRFTCEEIVYYLLAEWSPDKETLDISVNVELLRVTEKEKSSFERLNDFHDKMMGVAARIDAENDDVPTLLVASITLRMKGRTTLSDELLNDLILEAVSCLDILQSDYGLIFDPNLKEEVVKKPSGRLC